MVTEAAAERQSQAAPPPPAPLRPGFRLARAALRIAWQGLRLLWLASLIVGLALVIVGYQTLKQTATLPANLGLVARAYRETSIGLMALGMLVLIYLVGWHLPVTGRFYDGERSLLTRAIHLGWSLTALGWLYYAVFDSFIGVAGPQWIEYLRLLAWLFLASVCFLQGTRVGRDWSRSAAGTRRLAGLFALGFIAFALTETLTLAITQRNTEFVWTAFQYAHDPIVNASLSPDYWIDPQSSGILDVSAYLANAPWFLLAYIYACSAFTAQGLPTYFRDCPAIPDVLRRLARRLPWELLYGWLPAVTALLLWGTGALAASLLVHASDQQAGAALGRVFSLFLLGVPLGIWASFYAHALAASHRDGQLQDTKRRRALLQRTRFSYWLVFLVAGLLFGNLALFGLYLGAAPLVRLSHSQGTYWLFAVAAFAGILLPYVLFAELPFWLGQRSYREERLQEAGQGLAEAEAALGRKVAPDRPPSAIAVPDDGATTVDLFAWWYLAREQLREAGETPLFTVKNLGQLLRQLINKAGVALILPFISPTPSNPIHDLLLTAWNWLTSAPSG